MHSRYRISQYILPPMAADVGLCPPQTSHFSPCIHQALSHPTTAGESQALLMILLIILKQAATLYQNDVGW